MRETLYQRLTFQQRRQLHLSTAEGLELQQLDIPQAQVDQLLLFHWYLSEQRDYKESLELEQSHRAKRSVIVKRIMTNLSSINSGANAILKAGVLQKKSDSNVTWANRYTILSSRELRYYYSKEDSLQNPDNYLGAIPLGYIYNIIPLNDKAIGNKQFAFLIAASNWIKKNVDRNQRKFYFAADNYNQLEEWTIYLEFARSKASYDDFVNHFGRIQFPLSQQEDINPVFWNIDPPPNLLPNEALLQKLHVNQSEKKRFCRTSLKSKKSATKIDVVRTQENLSLQLEEQQISQLQHDELMTAIKQYLQIGFFYFLSHLVQQSVQANELSYRRYGEVTQFLKSEKTRQILSTLYSVTSAKQKHTHHRDSQVLDPTTNAQSSYQIQSTSKLNSSQDLIQDSQKQTKNSSPDSSLTAAETSKPKTAEMIRNKFDLLKSTIDEVQDDELRDSKLFVPPEINNKQSTAAHDASLTQAQPNNLHQGELASQGHTTSPTQTKS